MIFVAYLLVLVPILFGVNFLLTKEKAYRLLSYTLSAICMILSILLLINGPQRVELSGKTFIFIEGFITIFEFGIVTFLTYTSIKHKKNRVAILSIIQGIVMIYTLIFTGKESSAYINIDKLSILMLLIINIVGTLIVVFSNGYISIYENHRHMKSRQNIFFSMISIFLGSMNALVICDSLAWMLFFWEITTVISFILISYNEDQEAYNSGFRALGLNLMGGIAFALGNILLKDGFGITTLTEISKKGSASGIYMISIFLLCIAGFAKSAQFPFQSWLIGAMVAPTPVSALLHSSTMVKAGVFLIIKLSPAYANTWLGSTIAIYGAFSFLLCSAIAVSQNNAKRILAYSTVANLGLIICCAGMGTTISISAAIILIIFHSLSKALLFLTTGQTEHVINSRIVDDMTGLINIAPGLTLIKAFGIISMILPPFGVLVTKWLSIEASATNPIVVILLAFGSALTNLYYVKWLSTILASPTKKIKFKNSYDKNIYVPLLILCLLIILTSAGISPIYNYLVSPEVSTILNKTDALVVNGGKVISSTGTFNNTLVLLSLIILIVVYAFLRKPLTSSAKQKNIYMCGENNSSEEGAEYFRSFDGTYVKAEASNLYFRNLFNERKLNKLGYITSLSILITVLIGGLI